MKRKVSAPNWKYPRRMTFRQWRRLSYREKYWDVAAAQCDLLEFWRDCAKPRCRRAQRCLFPRPCYWDRKKRMSDAEQKQMNALCQPLRQLLRIGSTRGSEGLWLF
jgi:hypothetical protein